MEHQGSRTVGRSSSQVGTLSVEAGRDQEEEPKDAVGRSGGSELGARRNDCKTSWAYVSWKGNFVQVGDG